MLERSNTHLRSWLGWCSTTLVDSLRTLQVSPQAARCRPVAHLRFFSWQHWFDFSASSCQPSELTEQPIKDAVITVPAFFNQAERRAVLQAAQMAGLKVLQLINDNTAVALNYGVFRRKDIDSTAKVQRHKPVQREEPCTFFQQFTTLCPQICAVTEQHYYSFLWIKMCFLYLLDFFSFTNPPKNTYICVKVCVQMIECASTLSSTRNNVHHHDSKYGRRLFIKCSPRNLLSWHVDETSTWCLSSC